MLGYKDREKPNEFIINCVKESIILVNDFYEAKIIYEPFSFKILDDRRLILETGDILSGTVLVQKLKGCSEIILAVLTLGSKIENEIKETVKRDILSTYILDTISTYMLEKISDYIWSRLQKKYESTGKGITSFISPGSYDFNIEEQEIIFSILKPEKIGVRLTKHYVMDPLKSISAIMGVGKIISSKRSQECCECDKKDCFMRGILYEL